MERLRQMRPCIAAIGCLCFSNQSAISAISLQLLWTDLFHWSVPSFFYTNSFFFLLATPNVIAEPSKALLREEREEERREQEKTRESESAREWENERAREGEVGRETEQESGSARESNERDSVRERERERREGEESEKKREREKAWGLREERDTCKSENERVKSNDLMFSSTSVPLQIIYCCNWKLLLVPQWVV